jgi:hypothetical protein
MAGKFALILYEAANAVFCPVQFKADFLTPVGWCFFLQTQIFCSLAAYSSASHVV